MKESMNVDEEIRENLVSNLHSPEPSETLMRRLRVSAHETKPARLPRWQVRTTLIAGAGAIALAAGLTLMPAKASARTYERLLKAAEDVHSFLFTVESEENGKKESVSIAGLDGKMAIKSDDGGLVQISQGVLKVYDPGEKKITRIKLGNVLPLDTIMQGIQTGLAEGMKETDLPAMLKEFEQKYGKDHIHISGVQNVGGKNIYTVDLQAPDEPERVHMDVDADSDLPVYIKVDKKDGGAWKTDSTIHMNFGGQVDPSMLEIEFPAGVKVEDIDVENMMKEGFKGLDGEKVKEGFKGFNPGKDLNIDLFSKKAVKK